MKPDGNIAGYSPDFLVNTTAKKLASSKAKDRPFLTYRRKWNGCGKGAMASTGCSRM
jgi:hypothetical protein